MASERAQFTHYVLWAEMVLCLAPAGSAILVTSAGIFAALGSQLAAPAFAGLCFLVPGAAALRELSLFAFATICGRLYPIGVRLWVFALLGIVASIPFALMSWRAMLILDGPLFLLGFHMLHLRRRLIEKRKLLIPSVFA